MNILSVCDASYSYHGKVEALRGVSLDVVQGEKLAIIGSNGSGKSTLLQIMAALVFPTNGGAEFRGTQLTERALGQEDFMRSFRSAVGYVFQDPDVQLFCPTVMDELTFGPEQLGLSPAVCRERAEEVMELLEIADIRSRPPHMLSGGEKKRVAIASALTVNPELVLLDEPTVGLDPRTQCMLMELILELHDAGKTMVIATHDLSLVAEIHSRVAVLSEQHTLVRTGPAEEILEDKEMLLNVNLIHEHGHAHGEMVHRHVHSHFFFHKH